MFSLIGGIQRCTRRSGGGSLPGDPVAGHGALVSALATDAASSTTLRERNRPLVISAPTLLADVHPSSQHLLLDPGIA
jgi:hypothetical protein